MTNWMMRWQLYLSGHRRVVLLFVAGYMLVGLLLVRRLRVDQDFTGMLPMSDPVIAEQVEALRRIRQADRLFIDVQTSTLQPDLLRQAADQMHAALKALPELVDLRDTVQEDVLFEGLAQMRGQLPGLLSSNDLERLAERLEPAALENRLHWIKQALTQPQGFLLKNVVQEDPVGWIDILADRIRRLQAGMEDARLVQGRITSPDGRHVLLSALPVFAASDLDRSAALLSAVQAAAHNVESQFAPGAVRIALSGAHRMTLDNATLIRTDSMRTSLLATAAIALLLLAAHRRPWLALLGLAPTAFGLLGALLIFALTREPVAAAALGFGSILIGVTVDYGIYLLYTADDSMPRDREDLAGMVTQLTPPIIWGALTTMAAFWVMFLSPMTGHRQLAIYGAAGVALAVLFALLILPLLVGTDQTTGARRALPLTSLMEQLFLWRQRWRRILVPAAAVFSMLCLVGLLRLQFDGDLARLNGVTEATRRDESVIQAVWGKALSLTTVVVSGADLEEALQKNDRLFTLLERLQAQDSIETFSSIAPLFPAPQTRRANLRQWKAFWTAERWQDLSNNLAAAAADLGFRAAAFQPFLGRLQDPVEELAPNNLDQTPLGQLLSDYWMAKDGRISLSTRVKARDYSHYQQLRAAVASEIPDALLLNKTAMSHEIARVARRALPLFAVLVVSLNALLLFFLLGRVQLVLITLLPMGTGVFWTLGTLGLLGFPIDLSNFIFVIFVVGVGGDYSLFLVTAELESLRGHSCRTASTSGAVTVSALTTLLGVGMLVLARHPALYSVGLTALLGISLSLLATLFLVPACMDRVRSWKPVLQGAAQAQATGKPGNLRSQLRSLYRYQGPYVTQFVYWKTKIDPLCQAVDAALPPDGIILDLGCGFGLVAHWLTLSAPERRVVGVDQDTGKIRVAQATARHNPRVSFAEEDVLAWDYPPCDHVVCGDLLHYFPRELKLQILRRACGAMRPGGRLVLRDACHAETARHRAVVRAERWAVWAGLNQTAHGLNFESLAVHLDLLAQAGFSLLQTNHQAGLGSNLLIVAAKGEMRERLQSS